MTLYDPTLVDHEVKAKILEEMIKYDSTINCWLLVEVAIELIALYSVKEKLLSSSYLDELNRHSLRSRSQYYDFYWWLEHKPDFSTPRQRLPNGTGSINLPALVISQMQNLSYPVKANTWFAICEEWLQICNADWVDEAARSLGGIPPRAEEIAEWIPNWMGHITWFY